MKLYLLSQTKNNDYDTYDSCIVCALDEESARLIRPDSRNWEDNYSYSWVIDPEHVKVKYIGEADSTIDVGIILSSFNAG
jgi:hypothetical protein